MKKKMIKKSMINFEEEYTIDEMKKDADMVEDFLQKVLEEEWDEETVNEFFGPIYALSLESKIEYFYNLSRKTYMPLANNMQVTPFESDIIPKNISERFFIVNNDVFEIDPKKVAYIGWN